MLFEPLVGRIGAAAGLIGLATIAMLLAGAQLLGKPK